MLDAYPIAIHPALITKNEWQELALDQVIKNIDMTKTAGGPWGLSTAITPTTDVTEIQQRQAAVRFLVEHPGIHAQIQQLLAKIAQHEIYLWTYWNPNDYLTTSAQRLYYNLPLTSVPFIKKIQTFLNNNSYTLEASLAIETTTLFSSFVAALFLKGLQDELVRWVLDDKNEKPLSLFQGLWNTLKQPFIQHSFTRVICKDNPPVSGWSFKKYVEAFLYGTLGDRYAVLTEKHTTNIDLGLTTMQQTSTTPKPLAFLLALGPTLLFDYIQYQNILRIYTQLRTSNDVLKGLHERLVYIADYMKKVMELHRLTDNTPLEIYFPVLAAPKEYEEKMKKFFDLLFTHTFTSTHSYFYSRGKTLLAHSLLLETKNMLIPLLQSVAQLDAYSSFAELMIQLPHYYCFASFDTTIEEPYFILENAWTPLLAPQTAVANTLSLGNTEPTKMLITGPHGSGKSVILKTMGHSVILAHSLGIAPATAATLTPLHSFHTCLGAKEDIEQQLSTFMAEAYAMNNIFSNIEQSRPDNRCLVLVDEPYRGTLERTSGKRIYEFGKAITNFPYAMTILTTHHRQPIELAHDTQGAVRNVHVTITEHPHKSGENQFERLFKLADGPATWWFDDQERQERFADWIGSQTPLILRNQKN